MSQLLVVVGPTASGKSDLALEVAERLGAGRAEIVNADSMQVYAGMDIGTAKTPPDQRRGIEHHLLDIWPITHAVTVAEFQALARATINQIQQRGRHPILVGGSGLYIRAVIDDLRFPGTDPEIRAQLEQRLDELGAAQLHAELAEQDPAAAERILPTNGRRIVRALEVIQITGEPFSATLPEETTASQVLPCTQVGIDWPDEQLAQRIAHRVLRMWDDGLLDEVRALSAQGLAATRTAARALGYSQALQYLAGEITKQQAQEQTIIATRRFARRQRAWFRRDPRIRWYDGRQQTLVDAVLAQLS